MFYIRRRKFVRLKNPTACRVKSANAFVERTGNFVVSAGVFVVSADGFVVSAGVLVKGADGFVVSAVAFVVAAVGIVKDAVAFVDETAIYWKKVGAQTSLFVCLRVGVFTNSF